MNESLPAGAQAQFDKIVAKLLGVLETDHGHTSALSEFVDYDGARGGKVLQSEPPIEHPHAEFLDLYTMMFEQAKKEGLRLREIQTLFERETPSAPWQHRTRWIEVGEHRAFNKEIALMMEELGEALCKIAAKTSPDWCAISYSWSVPRFGQSARHKLAVLYGDRQSATTEPTPQLLQHFARISDAARADGLEVTGVTWDWDTRTVEEDAGASTVKSVVRVLHAWPSEA